MAEGKDESRRILEVIFGPPAGRGFAVHYWDGDREGPSGSVPFTLRLRHPGALRRMLWPPTERRLGEAFLDGDFDVEGDLEAAASLAEPIEGALRSLASAVTVLAAVRRLPRSSPGGRSDEARPHGGRLHSPERDADAVRFHYDVGNDFYRLWLDQRMVYSCGYFGDGARDLDHAQEAKLDLVCRKLRLAPGERLLDVGCGWGGLVIHAAERYGVQAVGITLSERQIDLARDRVRRAGLEDRCRIELADYRAAPRERFDKIASVGMVEHVGRDRLPRYFAEAWERLEPGGLFLNHGIVTLERPLPAWKRAVRRRLRRWTSFVDRYVFPDGELVSLGDTLRAAEHAGWETRDVENLREHYVRTLRAWLRRLEERRGEALRIAGERTFRVWRLYMAASAFQFATARIALVQSLLAKPDARGRVRVPRTREDLYLKSRPASPPDARRAG